MKFVTNVENEEPFSRHLEFFLWSQVSFKRREGEEGGAWRGLGRRGVGVNYVMNSLFSSLFKNFLTFNRPVETPPMINSHMPTKKAVTLQSLSL